MTTKEDIKVGDTIRIKQGTSFISQTYDGHVGKVTACDQGQTPTSFFTVVLTSRPKPIWLLRSEFERIDSQAIPQEDSMPMMFYGNGTTIKTFFSTKTPKLYTTLLQNDLYGKTAFVVSQADTLPLAKQQHEFWIHRMTRPELPKFLTEITPTKDVVRWRSNVIETTKPVQEAVTEQANKTNLDKTETPIASTPAVVTNTKLDGDFYVMRRFGISE